MSLHWAKNSSPHFTNCLEVDPKMIRTMTVITKQRMMAHCSHTVLDFRRSCSLSTTKRAVDSSPRRCLASSGSPASMSLRLISDDICQSFMLADNLGRVRSDLQDTRAACWLSGALRCATKPGQECERRYCITHKPRLSCFKAYHLVSRTCWEWVPKDMTGASSKWRVGAESCVSLREELQLRPVSLRYRVTVSTDRE